MSDMEEKKVWGIHTLNDALFLSKSVIAIGWSAMGDLSKLQANRQAFKEQYARAYPEEKKQSQASGAGMLYRFTCEVQIGDFVVYPSKIDKKINIGVIEGPYCFNASEAEYVQQRKVKWLKHLPRTAFSQGALYEVGSAMSFFSVKNYAEEYLNALELGFQGKEIATDDEKMVVRTSEGIIQSTKDFILKELRKNLKGYDLENFVAALLEAMGYRTKVSAHGGDRGIDIQAYKDELPPRILVQVKSQDGDVRETTIQSLKGAMREGDYGLFVTLSGYTKNARDYLNNTPIIRGIDGDELADLILRYYDKLHEKYRRMIPLEMIYIPAVEN